MGTGTRRAFGAVAFLVGIALMAMTLCPVGLVVADYFNLINSWEATCPSKFERQALLIIGALIFLFGHRLFTGRDLRTGKKPEL